MPRYFSCIMLLLCTVLVSCATVQPATVGEPCDCVPIDGGEVFDSTIKDFQQKAAEQEGYIRGALEAGIQYYEELKIARQHYADCYNPLLLNGGLTGGAIRSHEELVTRMEDLKELRLAVSDLYAKSISVREDMRQYCLEREVPPEFTEKFIGSMMPGDSDEEFLEMMNGWYQVDLETIDHSIDLHRILEDYWEYVRFDRNGRRMRFMDQMPDNAVEDFRKHRDAVVAGQEAKKAIKPEQ